MSKQGQSAYGAVDGETVIDLPTNAFRGRSGGLGKTFSGYLDLSKGEIRIDCADDFSFWLTLNLNGVPGLAAAPGGVEAQAAQEDFDCDAKTQKAAVKQTSVMDDGPPLIQDGSDDSDEDVDD
jgi:hypothetical protein